MNKFIVLLLLKLTSFALAQFSPLIEDPRPNLYCVLEQGTLKITNYQKTWKKTFMTSPRDLSQVECTKEAAVAVIGSNFVFFSLKEEKFYEKYIMSMPSNPVLRINRTTAAALLGNYLIVAQEGRSIEEKYILTGSANSALFLEVSKNTVFSLVGSYFYIYSEGRFLEKYIMSNTVKDFQTFSGKSALITSSYFIVFSNGRFYEKSLLGFNRNEGGIISEKGYFAYSHGNYFIIFDTTKNQFKEKYVLSEGRLILHERMPLFISNNGDRIIYNPANGNFVEI